MRANSERKQSVGTEGVSFINKIPDFDMRWSVIPGKIFPLLSVLLRSLWLLANNLV